MAAEPITYAVASNPNDFKDHVGPSIGTVIQPGGYLTFTMARYGDYQTWVWFDVPDVSDEQIQTRVGVWLAQEQKFLLHSYVSCAAETSGQCMEDESARHAIIMDPVGTNITVGPDDPTRQTELLSSLCDSHAAACVYTPTSQAHTYNVNATIGHTFVTLTDMFLPDKTTTT
jgi:hypothetical protein